MDTIKRFLPKTSKNFFLFGPRGTGKSTWLKKNFPDALYLDLLIGKTYRSLNARPERLIEVVHAQEPGKIIVLDEIQKIPQLLDAIHFLIEEDKNHQFIMTGSSARKLRRAGVNLLGGRAALHSCHPFLLTELSKENYTLEKALRYGLVPVVIDSATGSDDLQANLDDYIDLYISQEVKEEGLVRNISGFNRFLEAISFSHGSLLNVSNVASECEVDRKTAQGFVSVLEDLLLAYKISVFSKRAKRQLIKHSKFYFFDAGVFRALRPQMPLDKATEAEGPALEGLVLQHLKAYLAYTDSKTEVFFWRTKGGLEVDFIVYGRDKFQAIEVKNSRNISSKDLRSLKEFGKDYPEAELMFLYRGEHKLKKDNITCYPVEDFIYERFQTPS